MENLRILIAEDENIIAEDIKTSLERSGYTVVAITASAREAIAKAEELEPDLVLMDIQLQGSRSGLEAAEQIRARLDIPVIYLTAYADPLTIRRAVATRSFGYLIKPFDEKDLEETIKTAVSNYRAERSLEQSRLWMGTILKSISDGVIAINREEYITYINPAAESLIGWRQAEGMGQRWSDVLRITDEAKQPVDSREITKVLEEGIPLERADQVLQSKTKGRVLIDSVASPTRDRRGHITGAVIIFRDITRRKRLEEALRQRAQELATVDRAKDDFIAMLSHELRTPLNAILGWVRLLRGGKLDTPGTQQAIATIERNAQAQARLIQDLLDISRIVSGKLHLEIQSMELAPLVEVALESLRPAIDAKSLQLDVQLDRAIEPIRVDPNRLRQVIWNLLSNAVKFTPTGGRVEIQVQRADAYAEIVVRDTGIGISADFLPYVFDRFRQAREGEAESYTVGLGLGLTIVRHLVELHGGTVQAQSPGKGRGATFTVRLPLMGAAAIPLTPAGARVFAAGLPPANILDRLNVLVVDDERDARDFVAVTLQQYGARVITAASAGEATAAIEHARPDVLISDLSMPAEDGYALIRKVRARSPEQGGQTPAIALTAYVQEGDRQRALAAGYQIHIPKPVDPGELVTAIAHLTGRAPQGACEQSA